MPRTGEQLSTPEAIKKRSISISLNYQKKRKQDLQLWKEGKIEPTGWRCRTLLIAEFGPICQACGWSEINPCTGLVPIELEHSDGNYKNNKYDNVKLLCPNCHSLTPFYKALNAGRGYGRPDSKVVSQWAKERRIRVSTGMSY